MDEYMESEVERIFNRQFKRLESKLIEANCPSIFIEGISRSFNFTKKDIKELMENGKTIRNN